MSTRERAAARTSVGRGSERASSMSDEEGQGHECELLQEDRRRERDGRPDVAGSRQQRKREKQRQDRRRVGGAEPGPPHEERTRCDGAPDREPPRQRRIEEENGEEASDRGEEDEHAVVVER